MHKKENDFKREIVYYSRVLDEKGLVNSLEGNLSILDRETDEFYITPSKTRKSLLTEDMIAVLKDDVQIGGSMKYSSEYLLHKAALRARSDCNAALHAHAPCLTAFAYCNKDIELSCSATFALLFENRIPCLPYGEAGTIHIADGIDALIKDHSLILLGNHGCISVGRTMEEAVSIMEAAEEVMKIYLHTKSIGDVCDIPSHLMQSLLENHPSSVKNRYK